MVITLALLVAIATVLAFGLLPGLVGSGLLLAVCGVLLLLSVRLAGLVCLGLLWLARLVLLGLLLLA